MSTEDKYIGMGFVRMYYMSHVKSMRTAARNRWKYQRMMLDSDSRDIRKLYYRYMEEERATAIYEMGRAIWWKRELERMMGAP